MKKNAQGAGNASGYARKVRGYTGLWRKTGRKWLRLWTGVSVSDVQTVLWRASQRRYDWNADGKKDRIGMLGDSGKIIHQIDDNPTPQPAHFHIPVTGFHHYLYVISSSSTDKYYSRIEVVCK